MAAVERLFLKIRKKLQRKKDVEQEARDLFKPGKVKELDPNLPLHQQAKLLPYDPKWEVAREDIQFGSQIGRGAFRCDAKSLLNVTDGSKLSTVVLKMSTEHTGLRELAMELKVLMHLGQHPNIINLMGANTLNVASGELWVLLEDCYHRDLNTFIRQHRDNFVNQIDPVTDLINASRGLTQPKRKDSVRSEDGSIQPEAHSCLCRDDAVVTPQRRLPDVMERFRDVPGVSAPFTTTGLVYWAWQVAQGMDFLSSKKVVNIDIATRCLQLTHNNIVKISDVGQAWINQDEGASIALSMTLGIKGTRWQSIEVMQEGEYSVASDVWAYGITLWEMFSLATVPYPGLQPDANFIEMLMNGYRMERPEYANKRLYQLMLSCWEENPESRPSFVRVADDLLHMLSPEPTQESQEEP